MLLQHSSVSGQATAAATPPSTPVVLHPPGVSPSARIPAGTNPFDALSRLNHRMSTYRGHSSGHETRYSSVCDSMNNKSLQEAAQLRQQMVSNCSSNSGSKSKGSKSSGGAGSRAGNKRSIADGSANGSAAGSTAAAASGRANKLPKLTPKSTPSATTPIHSQQQQQQLPPSSSSPSSACSLQVEFKNNYSNGNTNSNNSHCSDSNGLMQSDVKPVLGGGGAASHPNTPSSRMPSTPTPISSSVLMTDLKRETLDHHHNGSVPNGTPFDKVVGDVSYPGLENFNSDLKDQCGISILADLDSLPDTDHFQDEDYVKNIMLQIQTTCATPVATHHFNLHHQNNSSHNMHHSNNHNNHNNGHLNHHVHNNSPHNPHLLPQNQVSGSLTQHPSSCPPGMSQASIPNTTHPPHHHLNNNPNNMMNGRVPPIPAQQHFTGGNSGNQSFVMNGGGDAHSSSGDISVANNSIMNPSMGMQSQQMRPSPMRGTSPVRSPYGHPQQQQLPAAIYSSRVLPGQFSDQRGPPQQQPNVPPAMHLMNGPDSYGGYPSTSAPPGYGQSSGGSDIWTPGQMQQQQSVPPQNQGMRPQQMPHQTQQQQQHLQQQQFMQSRAQYSQGPVASNVNMGPVVGHPNGFPGQQQQQQMSQVVGNGSGQQQPQQQMQMLSRQMSAGPGNGAMQQQDPGSRPQMHMQRQMSVGPPQPMNQQHHSCQGQHGF